MSILAEVFILIGRNNKKIIFSRPFLNNERELTFLSCNEFLKFPRLQFVINEESKSIEIRSNESKKISVLIRGINESFFNRAMKAKQRILNMVRQFSEDLKTGKEKIYIFETNSKEFPYYFTTDTLLEYGEYSIKFEVGFLYYLNEQGKKAVPFESFMDLQKKLSSSFSKINKDRFKTKKENELYYEMTFGQLYQIA